METRFPRRLRWLVWFAALFLWVAIAVFPLSNLLTRAAGAALLAVVWFGFIGLVWNHRLARFLLLAVTMGAAAFLLWPSERQADSEALRASYLTALQRYDDVAYFWGGESVKGIDCSGLIRRGWVDGLFILGCRTFNPSLVRQALDVWWHDASARALGEEYRSWTSYKLETPSVNQLATSAVQPGDLAVTRDGLHIMAYLGNQRWIEADPTFGKVVQVTVPSPDNIWFKTPMKIVRWRLLEE